VTTFATGRLETPSDGRPTAAGRVRRVESRLSSMEGEAWQSIDVIRNKEGKPHVLQQKVEVYTAGMDEESAGYTKPTVQHRLVPLAELTKFGSS
jgi:hypothetical protein